MDVESLADSSASTLVSWYAMCQLHVPANLLYIALLCAMVWVLLRSGWSNQAQSRARLPPGPKRLPILGNAHQITEEYQHYTFAQWARRYGDLMYARFFTRPILIINSQKVARDLLDKRSGKYSSRSRMVMWSEIVDLGLNIALLPYDNTHWRKQRRWIQSKFGDKAAVQRFESLQQRETCILVYGLMCTPHGFASHIKRYVSALIMESVYGHRVTSLDDEYITLIDRTMDELSKTGPAGGTIVDFFPLLKYMPAWMPGAAWKRQALRAIAVGRPGRYKPYAMVRSAVEAGTARPSYVSGLIQDAMKTGRLVEEEADIRESAGALYGAGTDTAKTTLLTFILAMVLHPNVYLKAQEEVDRVVGRDRLPTLADREELQYLDCIQKEVYRWNAPIPLGIPHHLTEDDEYKGFHLPANTGVIANLWSMTHSETVYGDPDVFRPERFLESDFPDPEIADPRNIVFGHGRRICPGRLFGDAAVFLAMSSMIATLDIMKARDLQGREITPEASFSSGFISYPRDFVCSITPRSPEAVNLIADMLATELVS